MIFEDYTIVIPLDEGNGNRLENYLLEYVFSKFFPKDGSPIHHIVAPGALILLE